MIVRIRFICIASLIAVAGCGPVDNERRVVGEMASDRIELTAEVNEPIVGILVQEGDTVAAGQLLLVQDSTRATARLAEADAFLAEARARRDELVRGPRSEQIEAARASVDGAVKEHRFQKVEHERAEKVHAQKLASPDVLDRATVALDTAAANLQLRRAQLQELLSGTTVEELEQVQQAVLQAAARRDVLAVDLARHELRAPVDGIVDSRIFEIGERPAPGQILLVMLSGTQSYARVYIPEPLRIRVTPGDPAMIHVDGLDNAIPGRVRWVSSDSAFTPYYALTERDRGRLSYLAKIDISEHRARLADGMPVEVDLRTGDGEE